MHLDWSEKFLRHAVPLSTTHLRRDVPGPRRLPVYCSSNVTNVPPEVTSLFVAATNKADTVLLPGMFQFSGSSALRVLHVSFCTFSFSSPPFLCCSNLGFLLLDHCKDKYGHTKFVHEDHVSHSQSESWRALFQSICVLDLRYTNWYRLLSKEMISLMANLRELNVEGVKEKRKHWSITDLCDSGVSLVKLRIIVNQMPAEDEETSENSLKMVMPTSLELFSFINKATTAAKISSISFQSCSQLKSILLRGFLGNLEELDLSGTSVKTLDLREVKAPNLRRLILIDCKQLCAILWPPENKRTRSLKVLRISTIQSASPSQPNCEESTKVASAVTRSSSIHTVATSQPGISQAASFHFNRYISVRDARLLRSLVPFEEYIRTVYVHMEVDSSPKSSVVAGGSDVAQGIRSLQQPDKYLYARDIELQEHLQAGAGTEGATSWMWACPSSPTPGRRDWYVHIQDGVEIKSRLLQLPGSTEETISSVVLTPAFICNSVRTMHVHDSLAITCIPCQNWGWLDWCRVERCPNLRVVFPTPQKSRDEYKSLITFWASQLTMACYIWNWSAISQPGGCSFSFLLLVFLHLDYCPRLIHVIPLSTHMATLPRLETLEIVCCGDLREVFPLDPKRKGHQKIIEFPRLRRIHLYELPRLQHICGSRMSAPKLETVKIRGCWSLMRLPAIGGNCNKQPKVSCEKDWWDNLEWDGLAANHHPSHYKLTHSMYYKKAQLPRGPLLR